MSDTHLPVPEPETTGASGPTRADSTRYVWTAADGEDADSGIRSFLSVLGRRRWTIFLGALPVWILAVVVTVMMPKEYESTATFLVEQGNGSLGSAPFAALEQLGSLTNTVTEVEVARSRSVMEPVVEELALHVSLETDDGEERPESVFPVFEAARDANAGRYEIRRSGDDGEFTYEVRELESGRILAEADAGDGAAFAGITLVLPEAVTSPVVLRVSPFAEAVEKVQAQVAIQPVRREVDLIELRCTSGDPRNAQLLCESILDSYLSVRGSLQRTEAKATAEFLADQVERVETRLRAAEDSLRQYLSQNRAIASTVRANEGVRQFVALRAERDQLEAERAALAQLIEEIENEDDTSGKYRQLASFPTFIANQNHVVTQLVQSLVELENERVGLALRRTEANRDLAALDARIEEIEGQLHSIAVGYERALEAKIQSLGTALETTGEQLVDIPSQQMESARLERQVTLLEELYAFLQTRLREAEIAQAVTLPNVRLVDRASLPHRPSAPSVPLNLALGFGFGLGFGLLLALFREHTDNRIRERAELERTVGIPVLSMIPSLPRPMGPETIVNGKGQASGWRISGRRTSGQLEEMGREAFRTLSVELKFAADELGLDDFRTLAVTSPARGEGKTLTSCNLALALARQGRKTLLVDGDFRAQGVGRTFGVDSQRRGFSDVLEGATDWKASLATFGEDPQALHVLPAGRPNQLPPDFLGGQALEVALETFREEYDLIIFDTPPLNVLADALKVCTQVDGVVVVVRGGFTERDALKMTLDRLHRAKVRVAGIVLNDVELPAYYSSYPYAEAAGD